LSTASPLEVVKFPEAKRGFVLLPRRWVVEPSFNWAPRFRRLAFACLRLHHLPEAMNIIL
jgi:transposase